MHDPSTAPVRSLPREGTSGNRLGARIGRVLGRIVNTAQELRSAPISSQKKSPRGTGRLYERNSIMKASVLPEAIQSSRTFPGSEPKTVDVATKLGQSFEKLLKNNPILVAKYYETFR